MYNGYIKLHRKLLNNPLWKDCNANQKVVMITLLLMANHKPNKWIFKGEEFEVQAGQFITSLASISEASGCTMQVVRTCLLKFEKHGFLTNKPTNKNRLITIVNWQSYQGKETETNKAINKQLTSNQQAINKQLTTNKNDKNDKNNNIYIGAEKTPLREAMDYFESKGVIPNTTQLTLRVKEIIRQRNESKNT